jgi:hypothetical protein
MTQLYALSTQFNELAELASNSDGDMDQALTDTMEALEGEFNDKAIAIVTVAQNIGGDTDAIDNEIARLQARKKVMTNNQERLKDYLRENMEASGIKKIECPLFTINCVQGREVAVIDDEAALDDKYMKVKTSITPDKAVLTADLKAGPVEGAHLERAKSSIRIK